MRLESTEEQHSARLRCRANTPYDLKSESVCMSDYTQIRASRAGVVCAVKSDSNEGGASRKYADMANYVHILHKDNTVRRTFSRAVN